MNIDWEKQGEFPPVGTKCEAFFMHGASTKWRECEILMHGERECGIYVPELNRLGWCNTFRSKQEGEIKELLLPALRQLRHNNSEGFVAAYDAEEVLAILSRYNLEPKP